MRLVGLACLALLLLASGPAVGQEVYPNRPIDFVVTWGTGGGADAMARQLATLAQPVLGVALPIGNVPGASSASPSGSRSSRPASTSSPSSSVSSRSARCSSRSP
jgi:tripartite-type tricarboxylate transporter receptor subunit TctC